MKEFIEVVAQERDNRCGRCGSDNGQHDSWEWQKVGEGEEDWDEFPCGWDCNDCGYRDVC